MGACRSTPVFACRLRPLVVCLAIACGGQVGAALIDNEPAIASSAVSQVSGMDLARPFAGFAFLPASELPPEHPTATFVVKNCDDDGQDSLRATIAAANALGVDSAIEFDLTAMGCSTITLTTGEIDVTVKNLKIGGPGPEVITINGGYSLGYYNRILKQTGSLGTLHLDHLVLTDAKYLATGNQQARGGCVYSAAAIYLSDTRLDSCHVFAESGRAAGGAAFGVGMKLVNSAVTNSSATSQLSDAEGGGIRSNGVFSAKDTAISNNSSVSHAPGQNTRGGGLALYATATFERSTISGNTAAIGGALIGTYSVAFADSTVADNSATEQFGAMWIQDSLALYNSTVALNSASAFGANAGIEAVSVYAVSSLIAMNVARSGTSAAEYDISSSDGHVSGSNNLIMAAGPGTTLPLNTLSACPRLAPMLDNGGYTPTHALLPGSPAINTGYDPFDLGTDQRGSGFDRVVGANADIGAYEWSDSSGEVINRSSFEKCE
jgi:hypothetical protein